MKTYNTLQMKYKMMRNSKMTISFRPKQHVGDKHFLFLGSLGRCLNKWKKCNQKNILSGISFLIFQKVEKELSYIETDITSTWANSAVTQLPIWLKFIRDFKNFRYFPFHLCFAMYDWKISSFINCCNYSSEIISSHEIFHRIQAFQRNRFLWWKNLFSKNVGNGVIGG